uniref:Uncharacterized protein n=1 Tax=Molossus molossus TaxID=27622 RepID=A0A7J8GRK2_MOLMO|nr:hypothetical protein HJG59_011321 [Molossus molossus]
MIKNGSMSLAGFAQWLECWPMYQRDPDSVPTQGTYLSCSLFPSLVGSCGWQALDVSLSHGCVSLPFSPSLPLYLKIDAKMSLGEDKKKKWVNGRNMFSLFHKSYILTFIHHSAFVLPFLFSKRTSQFLCKPPHRPTQVMRLGDHTQ